MLRFEAQPPPTPPESSEIVIVLDTAWTPPAPTADGGERVVGLRDLTAEVLTGRDLWDEALRRLDDWAEASGIVEAMTVDGVSYWYRRRLGAWWWLLYEAEDLDAAVRDERLLIVPVWAAAATLLPWIVRGRWLALDVIAASAWAAALGATTATLTPRPPAELVLASAVAGILGVAVPHLRRVRVVEP